MSLHGGAGLAWRKTVETMRQFVAAETPLKKWYSAVSLSKTLVISTSTECTDSLTIHPGKIMRSDDKFPCCRKIMNWFITTGTTRSICQNTNSS